MEFERARTKKQKDHRKNTIISATEKLYKNMKFDDISFMGIAKEADFTRSNLYKYFNSKEEIFIEMCIRDFLDWTNDIVKEFKGEKNLSVEEFSKRWTEIIGLNTRLLKLASLLHTILEKNASIESIVKFKTIIKDESEVVLKVLKEIFPDLTLEQLNNFFNIQLVLATGIYPMTNLGENQKKVLERPEFKNMKVDFKESYCNAIECYLRGLSRN